MLSNNLKITHPNAAGAVSGSSGSDPLTAVHVAGLDSLTEFLDEKHSGFRITNYGWGFNGISTQSASDIIAGLQTLRIPETLEQYETLLAKLDNYRTCLRPHLNCWGRLQSSDVYRALTDRLHDLEAQPVCESRSPISQLNKGVQIPVRSFDSIMSSGQNAKPCKNFSEGRAPRQKIEIPAKNDDVPAESDNILLERFINPILGQKLDVDYFTSEALNKRKDEGKFDVNTAKAICRLIDARDDIDSRRTLENLNEVCSQFYIRESINNTRDHGEKIVIHAEYVRREQVRKSLLRNEKPSSPQSEQPRAIIRQPVDSDQIKIEIRSQAKVDGEPKVYRGNRFEPKPGDHLDTNFQNGCAEDVLRTVAKRLGYEDYRINYGSEKPTYDRQLEFGAFITDMNIGEDTRRPITIKNVPQEDFATKDKSLAAKALDALRQGGEEKLYMMRQGQDNGGIGHFHFVHFDGMEKKWKFYSSAKNNGDISNADGSLADQFFNLLRSRDSRYECSFLPISLTEEYFKAMEDYIIHSRVHGDRFNPPDNFFNIV